MEENNWYDNKSLFEMLQEVKADISEMRTEMAETRTLIRDYNGLRTKVEETARATERIAGQLAGAIKILSIVISGISILFVILNFAIK
jgi:hypothetical protein